MDRFEEERCIGRGMHGTAHLVRDVASGRRYVVKKVALGMLNEEEQEKALREVELLRSLKHPNVVEYVDSFIEAESLHIVMEYCEGGDLAAQLKAHKKRGARVDEEQVLDWTIQLAAAVEFIHSRCILHRDLKSSNIFLLRNNVLKLGDFGIARVLDSTMDKALTVVGTPYYMSPEVCQNERYGLKSDIWAMGCILYEMCALSYPFNASNLLGLVYQIVQQEPAAVPDEYSPGLRQLVGQLLSKDPDGRPDAPAILRYPLLQQRLWAFSHTGTRGTLGARVVNRSSHVKQQREARKRTVEHQHAERLAEARRVAAQEREIARRRNQDQFRPSTGEHSVPLSQGDMHARSGNGEAAAAAGEGEEGEGEVLELAGTSKMQDPEDAPLFASGSPQPPLEGSGGGGRASAAEEKAALSESKIDFPTARDLADRPIYATGSYQWEEELAQTRGVGAVDAGAAGDDYANDSDDGGAGGDGADGGDSSSDYSDDFESDDEEREGAKDDEARAREQRDLETVLSLCRQHALDPSARQPAAALTEVVRGAGAAPAPAPAASARSRSPRSQRLAQKEARLRDQLGSATFDQLFRYFVSQLTAGESADVGWLRRLVGPDRQRQRLCVEVEELALARTAGV